MSPARNRLVVLAAALTFGVAAGLVKGNDTGFRDGIGNLSAPWLLVGFLPALRCRTLIGGAAMGLTSTVLALVGFYAALTVVLAGHLGGGGFFAEFTVEARANRVYFLAGIVTGPICGAAGAWLGRRHLDRVALVAGTVLAGEALAVGIGQGHQLAPPPLYFRWAVADWAPYLAEAFLGVLIIAAALLRNRRRARSTMQPR